MKVVFVLPPYDYSSSVGNTPAGYAHGELHAHARPVAWFFVERRGGQGRCRKPGAVGQEHEAAFFAGDGQLGKIAIVTRTM